MVKRTAVLALLLASMAGPSFAQRTTATIRGTVSDSTGAIVPGATVTVRGAVPLAGFTVKLACTGCGGG